MKKKKMLSFKTGVGSSVFFWRKIPIVYSRKNKHIKNNKNCSKGVKVEVSGFACFIVG